MRKPENALVQAMVVTLLTAVCYGIWVGLAALPKKTFIGDLRMLVSVLAIFIFLSLADFALQRLRGLGTDPSQD